jgi:tripartite-type tricarboxylate transporter receptor subunit TctC
MKLLWKFCSLALLAGLAWVPLSSAQSYPTKPIRLVVPFPPGGAVDIVARVVGQALSEAWGQQVVVDNRPGAGAIIGTDLVAKAAPDGYTLLMASVGMLTINPSLYTKLPYDPIKDFNPVILVGGTPCILVVHPALPPNSVKEFIAYAKSKPGQLNVASAGSGNITHLVAEVFRTQTGIEWVHVPYKGSAPALTDLLGGQVQLMFDVMLSALPHVKAGRLKALAVTSIKRFPQLPDLVTLDESGLPGFNVSSWWGVAAPAGTPKEIIAKLNGEVNKSLGTPKVKERLLSLGAEPIGGTPEQFSKHIQEEIVKWAKAVRSSGAKVD